MNGRVLLPLFLACWAFTSAAAPAPAVPAWSPEEVSPPSDAWVVASTIRAGNLLVDVPTGRISRSSDGDRPKSSRRVRGRVRSITWAWPRGSSTREVFRYLRAALGGEPWFECAGRNCGDAEYFAYTVFDVADLYGRDAQQFYAATPLRNGDVGARMLYVAERGTREVFAHLVEVVPDGGTAVNRLLADAELLGPDPLDAGGNLVAGDGSGRAEVLRRIAATAAATDILIVVHARALPGEDALARSRRLARALATNIANASARQVSGHGVGDLVPSVLAHDDVRVEFVTRASPDSDP